MIILFNTYTDEYTHQMKRTTFAAKQTQNNSDNFVRENSSNAARSAVIDTTMYKEHKIYKL